MNPDQLEQLILKAIEAKEHSYSPYSNFRVGCSLLTFNDQIYTGCNVENASYGLSICAERTALVKACSDGYRIFKAIAVSTDHKDRLLAPCGACRQFISEFGMDCKVILVKSKNDYEIHSMLDILPKAFDSSALQAKQS